MDNPERYKEILVPMGRRPDDIYNRFKTSFGWATSASGMMSRTGLYSTTLQNGVRLCGSRLKDNELVSQILGLEIRNGRIDHAPGEHDDLVIGWLLTIWLLTQGINLSHYGLDHRIVLSKAKEKEAKDPRVYQEQIKQTQIRTEIEELCDKLGSEKDDFVSVKLEQRIRVLERQISDDNDELNSVDEMIRKAKEKKKENIRNRRQAGHSYQDLYNRGVYYQNQFSNY